MSLTRSDHKRIALSIASELKKVLGNANGDRLIAKHKARMAPKTPEGADHSEDDILAELAEGEPAEEHGLEMEDDPMDEIVPQIRKKKKGFPPRK